MVTALKGAVPNFTGDSYVNGRHHISDMCESDQCNQILNQRYIYLCYFESDNLLTWAWCDLQFAGVFIGVLWGVVFPFSWSSVSTSLFGYATPEKTTPPRKRRKFWNWQLFSPLSAEWCFFYIRERAPVMITRRRTPAGPHVVHKLISDNYSCLQTIILCMLLRCFLRC